MGYVHMYGTYFMGFTLCMIQWDIGWYRGICNLCIYTWKTVRADISLSIMGFTRNELVFCSIAYFGFWLWRVIQILWQHRVRTSSDSLQKRNFSPKWSKLGVVIGYPNLATNTAMFPSKFGCTVPIKYYSIFSTWCWKKNRQQMSTYCPKYCL